jgi:hypothetical protein
MTIEQLAEQLSQFSDARLYLLSEALAKIDPARAETLQTAIGVAIREKEHVYE